MHHLRLGIKSVLLFLCGLGVTSCTRTETLWIYSSMRSKSEESLKQAFAQKFPSTQIKWYIAGSEKIAQTLEAEHTAGIERADLVVTADPFWYFANKQTGMFRPYQSPANHSTLSALNDSDHYFSAIRLMTVAIAYNPKRVAAADAPRSWKELRLPKWRGKISIPNPLESGTMFVFVSLISKIYGKQYLEDLKRNEVDVGTTSDSILARLESGDRPIAVLLVEDALRAKRGGASVEAVYPEDGAIAIPGFAAIMSTSKSLSVAKKAYDFLFSESIQNIFLENGMHSPLHLDSAPPGAKPWRDIHWQDVDWSGAWLTQVVSARDEIKRNFSTLFLGDH